VVVALHSDAVDFKLGTILRQMCGVAILGKSLGCSRSLSARLIHRNAGGIGGKQMTNRLAYLLVVLLSVHIQAQTATETKGSVAHSERTQFSGVWRVVSISDTRPDGAEVPDLYMGPNPIGFLIYDATGYMCAGVMNPSRAKWANESKGSKEELAAAAEGYDSYCGPYDVDEQQKRVVHHVRVGLVPNDVGVDLVRTYVFDGARLKLSGTDGLQPGFKFWTLTFERAKRSAQW
jgi:Lipocalin-like domain